MDGCDPTDSSTLFVGCLSIELSDFDLFNIFSAYGTVVIVRVQKCSKTGTPLGYGFVTMGSSEEAETAETQLNGKYLSGRYLKIRRAEYGLLTKAKVVKTKNVTSRLFNFEAPLYSLHFKFMFTHCSCSINEVSMRQVFEECGPILDIAIRKVAIHKV